MWNRWNMWNCRENCVKFVESGEIAGRESSWSRVGLGRTRLKLGKTRQDSVRTWFGLDRMLLGCKVGLGSCRVLGGKIVFWAVCGDGKYGNYARCRRDGWE